MIFPCPEVVEDHSKSKVGPARILGEDTSLYICDLKSEKSPIESLRLPFFKAKSFIDYATPT